MIYNVQVLEYQGFMQYRFYGRPVISENDDSDCVSDSILSEEQRKERSNKVSINRTKQSIYEIAYNNIWAWFVTFTFDDSIDRYDYDLCTRRVRVWLNNQKRLHSPDLKYLVIPEQHKNGAWHMHGLLAGCDGMTFEDSGRVAKNKKAYVRTKKNEHCPWIYNISDWKFGFSTATQVQDNAKTCSYMCKYITKDLCAGLKNKRRYFASKNCDKVIKQTYNWAIEDIEDMITEFYKQGIVDYDKTQNIECAGQAVRYLTIKK